MKEQAKAIACQGNLHQWSIIWSLYTADNDGRFQEYRPGETLTSEDRWPVVVRPSTLMIRYASVPRAMKCLSDGGVNPFAAWGKFSVDDSYGSASYGINEYVENRPVDNFWININNLKGAAADRIPLFLDCLWYDVRPFEVDQPPVYDGSIEGLAGSNEMRRVCLNRHRAAINGVFLDWSVRRIDLKELWTLKWHRNWNVNGMWTLAGGVKPSDWPAWMRRFKDY